MNHDMNHTDATANGGLPLSQPWERVAAKDWAIINEYLVGGLFVNSSDFADRLRQAADAIEEWAVEHPDQPPVSGAILEVLGYHVAALSVAAQAIASLTGGDVDSITLDLLRKGRMYYQNLSPDLLQGLLSSITERMDFIVHG